MHLVPIYLLDKDEILDRAVTVRELLSNHSIYRKLQGVYFLIHAGEIVYVGCTKNLRKRLQGHRKTGVRFTSVYGQEIEDECKYRAMETLYIGELRPKMNKTLRG